MCARARVCALRFHKGCWRLFEISSSAAEHTTVDRKKRGGREGEKEAGEKWKKTITRGENGSRAIF